MKGIDCMKNIMMKKHLNNEVTGNILVLIISIALIYLLIALYFTNHFFFNTVINGADVSLKTYDDANDIIRSYVTDYKLILIERDGDSEIIVAKDIGLKYNNKKTIESIYKKQNALAWIISLSKEQSYSIEQLYVYNKSDFYNKVSSLNCLSKDIVQPQNVRFEYSNGVYEAVKEVYGNKIYEDKLINAVQKCILTGETKLDLNKKSCYQNPKYTLASDKTPETKALLNKYVAANITYLFGSRNERINNEMIHKWIYVDDDLDAAIDQKKVGMYIKLMSKKYNTVGIVRKFKASTNKVVEVKGGFYGWEINCDAETKALVENIRAGEVLEKEPVYSQRAKSRDENDIGDTYVEINLTKQYLWFYKAGKLIAQGAIVTGNPNRGNATKVGVYMLNYKQKGSTLRGANYEAEVTYWMPFNGNIGIHDASWRYFFGGNAYKTNGSHGCVNAPLYLAKTIYENIEEGTPIVCYEEDTLK